MTIEGVYTLKDEKGDTSTMSVRLPAATLFADAEAFLSDFASLLDLTIDGVVTRIGMSFNVLLPGGLKVAALNQVDVERGATFIYQSAGGFLFRHRIATFKNSLIGAGSADVNLADADVINLVSAMNNGLTPIATLVQPSEHRGDDLAAINSARQTFIRTRG